MTTKSNPKFQKAYVRQRVSFNTVGESLTDQSQKDSTLIDKILKTYDRTGLISNLQTKAPMFDDVSDVGTFQEAMSRVAETSNAFSMLPAQLQEKFAYNPENWLKFVTDEKNTKEAIALGLLPAEASAEGSIVQTAPLPTGEQKQAAAEAPVENSEAS